MTFARKPERIIAWILMLSLTWIMITVIMEEVLATTVH